MTDGEKMIATSATISNNPRNLPRLMESTETLALPGSRVLLETLSSLRYTMTRETRPSTMTPPTMPSPDWRLRANRTRIRMNQANFDRNPNSAPSRTSQLETEKWTRFGVRLFLLGFALLNQRNLLASIFR